MESNGCEPAPPILQILRRAIAEFDASDAFPLRLLCRDTSRMVGVLKKMILKSEELLIMAADPLNECTVASNGSVASRSGTRGCIRGLSCATSTGSHASLLDFASTACRQAVSCRGHARGSMR